MAETAEREPTLELQKTLPQARVVKAFDTVFAQPMDTGRLGEQQLTAFVAADDVEAKTAVLGLARDIGFDAVDAGLLKNACLLEPLAYFYIQLGYILAAGLKSTQQPATDRPNGPGESAQG